MPTRPPKPCNTPGCPELAVGSPWCPSHAQKVAQDAPARVSDAKRPQARARGYDNVWRRCRNAYIAQHPFCECCEAPATLVHHNHPLDKGGARLDHWNLKSLCSDCHTQIHAHVDNQFAAPADRDQAIEPERGK